MKPSQKQNAAFAALITMLLLIWIVAVSWNSARAQDTPTPTPDGMECVTPAPDVEWCLIPAVTAVATPTQTPVAVPTPRPLVVPCPPWMRCQYLPAVMQ